MTTKIDTPTVIGWLPINMNSETATTIQVEFKKSIAAFLNEGDPEIPKKYLLTVSNSQCKVVIGWPMKPINIRKG